MVTVHALGGSEMMRAAVAAAAGRLDVVAVTVLTSHDVEEFGVAIGRTGVDLVSEAARLASTAMAAGVAGVVCSAEELPRLRPIVGAGRLVVPGIRRGESEAFAA